MPGSRGKHAVLLSLQFGAAGDFGGIAPGFGFSRGNKTLPALSLLGFFGPIAFFLAGLLRSSVAVFASPFTLLSPEIPRGPAPGFWLPF